MTPSIIGGALVPLAVYNLIHHHVHGDAVALAIAGIPAAAFVAFEWLRRHRIDLIGGAVLFGFAAGITISFAMGGDAFVLKVRDSVLTGLFGLVCLLSLRTARPAMFYVGRALSAGDDPIRVQAYNDLWAVPEARRLFAVITTVWGFGLMLDSATRIALARALTTSVFLAVSPAVAAVFFATLFAFTVRYSRRTRQAVGDPDPESLAAAPVHASPQVSPGAAN